MGLNIFTTYFIWHYFETPKEILVIWRNFILFVYNYFSIGLLAKTLFKPWRRDITLYGRGFDIKVYAQAAMFNIVARGVGFMLRATVILTGLFFEALVFIFGGILFIVWFLVPVLVVLGIILGVRVI